MRVCVGCVRTDRDEWRDFILPLIHDMKGIESSAKKPLVGFEGL